MQHTTDVATHEWQRRALILSATMMLLPTYSSYLVTTGMKAGSGVHRHTASGMYEDGTTPFEIWWDVDASGEIESMRVQTPLHEARKDPDRR